MSTSSMFKLGKKMADDLGQDAHRFLRTINTTSTMFAEGYKLEKFSTLQLILKAGNKNASFLPCYMIKYSGYIMILRIAKGG